ncbi:aldo/keto reductase [Aspergillus stella-maris]|uniref:aldo/keto reductase n=1 Tax=Aspergillus stella-maris TaxID=1810926 RepID=UPI003CCCC0D4
MALTTPKPKPKTAHVNMMTDTIIGNLPLDGLRAVMRGILTRAPSCTAIFEEQTRTYLGDTASRFEDLNLFAQRDDKSIQTTASFEDLRRRICCLVGCGLCYQALPQLGEIVGQVSRLTLKSAETTGNGNEEVIERIAAVDGDIVQALTAVQKTLLSPTGSRELTDEEAQPLRGLLKSLQACQSFWASTGLPFPLERGLDATIQLLGLSPESTSTAPSTIPSEIPPAVIGETFTLNGVTLPRLFTGLWQLSSPAWGSASRTKMMEQFSSYVSRGFTAFDMADHYGDAEIIFGRYRSSSAYSDSMFAGTKYCVFHPMVVSCEAVRGNVDERCRRLNTDRIDLLQFHWQFYNDDQYIKALQYLQEDTRVRHLGLCNFDTEHMARVVDSGVKIVTNQVQFSLIDSRPTIRMAEFCTKHDIKLLTYGTLCGGLLAEKWIGQGPPDLYSEKTTPSQRKYYASIQTWGGWSLFQTLLQTLDKIARKHNVTVSNVATRWVLDFPYVGAVIVGARMGVSEQSNENLASLGWTLDDEDKAAIEDILSNSDRQGMFERMGDCGGEYR